MPLRGHLWSPQSLRTRQGLCREAARLPQPDEPPLCYIQSTLVCVITAVDQFGNIFANGGAKAELQTSGKLLEPAKVVDQGDGTYRLSMIPTQTGVVRIAGKLDGLELSNMPLVVKVVDDAVCPGTCSVEVHLPSLPHNTLNFDFCICRRVSEFRMLRQETLHPLLSPLAIPWAVL